MERFRFLVGGLVQPSLVTVQQRRDSALHLIIRQMDNARRMWRYLICSVTLHCGSHNVNRMFFSRLARFIFNFLNRTDPQ